jgi:hypothetical protein
MSRTTGGGARSTLLCYILNRAGLFESRAESKWERTWECFEGSNYLINWIVEIGYKRS